MFNPNAVPEFHHRGSDFHTLVSKITVLMRSKFEISEDFDLLFLTGSGALALEACVFSAQQLMTPKYTGAKFGRNLEQLTILHHKYAPDSVNQCYVHYETSTSKLNESLNAITQFVDCVSSFPYYEVPAHADLWVTVSGKQLGAPPGISIVAVRRELWNGFLSLEDTRPSYLNLARYELALRKLETPNTPAMSTLVGLHQALRDTNFEYQAQTITERWNKLCDALGEPPGQVPPVYTFKRRVPEVHEAFRLYGQDRTQIFLYAGNDWSFYQLLTALQELKKEEPNSDLWW